MEPNLKIEASVTVTLSFVATVDVPDPFKALVRDYFVGDLDNNYQVYLADALVDHLVDDEIERKIGSELFQEAEGEYHSIKLVEAEE